MLLEDLHKIVKLGAKKPLFLNWQEFEKIKNLAILDLEKVLSRLDKGTEVFVNVQKLIMLLKQDRPNELELAKAFLYIADIFYEDVPSAQKTLINTYIQDQSKFYNNAQLSTFFAQKREQLKKAMNKEEQKQHDLRLFQHEGMMYCLEYYLAMYKMISDSKTEKEKKKYFENKEIDLGFGDVPGLLSDFGRDEVLSKFIYSILDDEARNNLARAYFDAKIEIMSRGIRELSQTVTVFKDLVIAILQEFDNIGITRLASLFFKPYGDKPLVKEVIRQI